MRRMGRRRLLAAPVAAAVLSLLVFCVELASDVGSLAASMAPEDFYAKNSSYGGTRVELHVRDWFGDPGTTAHADTKRTYARGLARRNSSAVARDHARLKIAMPKKHSFSVDIFKTHMDKLQHPRHFGLCVFNGTYDNLAAVHNVALAGSDGAAGDVTITADRVKLPGFTIMPYPQSGVSLLLLTNNESKPPIQRICLKPLTKEHWLTTAGFFFFTGFVAWMIEQSINPVFQGPSLTQFRPTSYFAFSTLTFSHGQIVSTLSKIIVAVCFFVVLVLMQSYTANLSSMLTAKRLLHSVTDLDQLDNATHPSITKQVTDYTNDVKRGYMTKRICSATLPFALSFDEGQAYIKNDEVSAHHEPRDMFFQYVLVSQSIIMHTMQHALHHRKLQTSGDTYQLFYHI